MWQVAIELWQSSGQYQHWDRQWPWTTDGNGWLRVVSCQSVLIYGEVSNTAMLRHDSSTSIQWHLMNKIKIQNSYVEDCKETAIEWWTLCSHCANSIKVMVVSEYLILCWPRNQLTRAMRLLHWLFVFSIISSNAKKSRSRKKSERANLLGLTDDYSTFELPYKFSPNLIKIGKVGLI